MKYKIELETHRNQNVIHTTITGTISSKERDDAGLETIQKMRGSRVSKAIWDIREAELDYSLIQSHLAVLNLGSLGVTREDFVAIISFHNQEQHEHAKTAAHNRGFLNIDYFLDIQEGIDGLISRK
jgi:hypothetical protein